MASVFAFRVTGTPEAVWCAFVRDGRATVREEDCPTANVTVTGPEEAWLDVFEGRLGPGTALMTGRLRASGDVSLCVKLHALLRGTR